MSSTVTVNVLSPDTRSERRFDLHITIGQLKNRLEIVTGIPASQQSITLCISEAEDEKPLAQLDDDSRPLGFYGVSDYQLLKVMDLNPSASLTGQFTDVSQVEKFELSHEEYALRQGTVLSYKERNKLGRFSEKPENASQPPETLPDIAVGSRCQVDSGEGTLKKRGTVRFIGTTKFGKGGVWVGIEYDEPLGKNEGSVEGERYFTCQPKHGAFVKPDRVTVGDFPPQDPFEDEEI